MKRISCTKLARMLISVDFFDDLPFMASKENSEAKVLATDIKSSCEAFGWDVRAYLDCGSTVNRIKFEKWLQSNGIPYDPYYGGNSYPVAEVKVSYFKAWHHDE